MSRQIKAAAFAAVLALAVVGSMAQVTIQRGWSLGMFADGSAAAPSISFASSPSSGWYWLNASTVMVAATSGSSRVTIGSAGYNLGSGGSVGWSSNADPTAASADTSLSRGGAAGKLTLTGTTPMIQLGGTSSSFGAIKNNAGAVEARLADDSGLTLMTASGFNYGSSIQRAGVVVISATAPSAPSACGTSPAVTTNNGTASWVVTGGTGGTATGCTITMPAATTGWNCSINNITGSAAHRADKTTVQTASTTTSVTWEYQTVSTGAATAFTASDVFRGICFAF